MGYVYAGYGIALCTLALYSLRVIRRRRALERMWR
jgi:heme exporter protein D